MKSVYHILDKIPAIYPEELQIEYEDLAQKLVASGRLRVDTDYYCNFVKYYDPSDRISIILSLSELTNIDMANSSKKLIKGLYDVRKKHITESKVDDIFSKMKESSKKLMPPTDEVKIRLARIFVQSAHPIVIKWLLHDAVQIYITYSNSIGDLMGVVDWKTSGSNSGMQSTDGVNACIYVSCGGDPFEKNYAENPTIGGGWAAVARLQIIAGQEIGHFADIVRDGRGNQITRHAADFACTKARPHVREARHNDIRRCNSLMSQLTNAGIVSLVEKEKSLIFYDRQKLFGLRVIMVKIMIYFLRKKLLYFASSHQLTFVKRFTRDRYMGSMIMAMIEDMKSNLSPDADVYKRSDPEAAEAIACAEALARIPQQVMKWGYLTTKATMHDLYQVYYGEVIPSLIKNYESVSGKKYRRMTKLPKYSRFKQILRSVGFFGKSFKFQEVRTPD